MKVGIIGLPQVGKKTLFELLTGVPISGQGPAPQARGKGLNLGVVKIRDPRFEKLVSIYSPKKQMTATIDVVLLPKFDKEAVTSGEFAKSLLDADALCHIVRAFKDESIFHIEGSVNAKRDIENVSSELVLSDLILIDKRIERMDKDKARQPDAAYKKEREVLIKLKGHLESGFPIRTFVLTEEDVKILSAYQFLTRKPMIVVLNVGEDAIKDETLLKDLSGGLKDQGAVLMQVSAKIEVELSKFTNKEEKDAFMSELGITESAIDKMTRLCYEALGLISFFTVGEDEVRAWTLRKGSAAPQAARAIHTDLERGFIRAEVMKYADIESYGSEAKIKDAGKLLLKGKDYIVEDGDIINIRFNV